VDGFDWRAREALLNRYPQFRAQVAGTTVHFLHVPGSGPDTMPLLLTHGWPSTCWEFLPVVGRLTEPGRFGADPADAFDVVVPSLPRYAFSDPLPAGGTDIPQLWYRLMTDVLGYPRFGAHGGDIGAMVTNRLALEHPEALIGIHVNGGTRPPRRGHPCVLPPATDRLTALSLVLWWQMLDSNQRRRRRQIALHRSRDSPLTAGRLPWCARFTAVREQVVGCG
jgi:pimeloyl-ACP methyl ester carboxylesterase